MLVKSEFRNGEVRVTVEDSGSGIDPKDIDKIFSSFFTTKVEGMGMGLSICRSIVESHGGRLSALPGHSHGAAFQFTLPVAGHAVLTFSDAKTQLRSVWLWQQLVRACR